MWQNGMKKKSKEEDDTRTPPTTTTKNMKRLKDKANLQRAWILNIVKMQKCPRCSSRRKNISKYKYVSVWVCLYTYSKWCKNQATSRSNRDDMAQRRVKRKRNEVMEDRKDEGWRKNGLNLRCCSVSWAECCLPSKMKKKRLQVPSQKHLETKNSQLKENEIRQFSIGFMCVGTMSKAHDCHVLALHSQWARARARGTNPLYSLRL